MADKHMEAHHPSTILMTADTLGGVWNYSLELIRALAPFGTHIHLATMGAPLSADQRGQVEDLSNVTLHESTYKLEWMENPWEDVEQAGKWLLDLKEQVQPDLVHLNNLVHADLPWGEPVVVVVHSCVLSWWQAVRGEEAPKAWDIYKERVTRSLQAADMVVAPTQAMMHQAETHYGPFQASSVVYNGRVQDRYQFGAKEPFVFSMGRVWDDAKNISTLAHIASELQWPVYIAGDGRHPATGQLVELENVHFLGQLSEKEVTSWLSRAAIYALPAKYEPFGLTILEAAMSGCALVIGKTDSLVEVWGNAAKYVDPFNADDLCNTINELIQNEFIRNIMGCRAVKRSHGYTSEPMGQDYDHVYRQLLKQCIAL